MLTMAIVGCVVFLAVLISSYWWGYHSRFSLGARLVDAKESVSDERSAQSNAETLEFDYVFERNRNRSSQANGQSTSASPADSAESKEPQAVEQAPQNTSSVVSLQAHRASKQAAQSTAPSASASNAPDCSSDDKDDLKKIWGIGKVFENLLNSKGIYTFEQLANISDELKDDMLSLIHI